MVYGFVTPNGNVTIIDGTTEGRYPPVRSSPSMLTNIAGRVTDGKLELSFTRPRGFDINRYAIFGVREQDCPHFLFPVEGKQLKGLKCVKRNEQHEPRGIYKHILLVQFPIVK